MLLHGVDETPESFWLPYLKKELEKKGYKVWVPQLPHNNPNLKTNLSFVLKNGQFNKDTIIISRSSGSPLALSVLENLNVQIKQAILVCGFVTYRPFKGAANWILQKNYKWKKIKSQVRDITFIHSEDDPWGCNDKEGRLMFDHLGGKLIIFKKEGHFGSNTFNQPYKKIPFLLKLIN